MNPLIPDDPYLKILFKGYNDLEIAEIQNLMEKWDQATYPTLANSIIDHGNRHDYQDNYLKYLRKAANFNKKGAKKTNLPNKILRWNKAREFLIERDSKIIAYREN